MNNILRDLEIAFKLFSSIPVTNDYIDVSSTARGKLSQAYDALKKIEKEKNEETKKEEN